MNDLIAKICKNIEKLNNVKILFAVENGSRAWRMHSKDSDYDVRFVFVRPLKEYIKIKKPVDFIDAAFDKTGKPTKVEGAFIDLCGFDIFKYSNLLASSNPTTIEWLNSDIVYYGKQNKAFKEFATKNYSKVSLYYHYKSMCKQNYDKYLKTRTQVTYKKYLYAYRGLVNAKWVVYKDTIPPIIFAEALAGMKNIIPEKILNKLYEIIRLKSSGKEKDIIPNIDVMDSYIENFLKDEKEAPKNEKKANLNILDNEIKKILLK